MFSFCVCEKESDLFIVCDRRLRARAMTALRAVRRELEGYIARDERFLLSFEPVRLRRGAPPVARQMAAAARAWDVGPMAAVAGAIAQRVGENLLAQAHEVIVENGGDIFLRRKRQSRIALYAGEWSPFTGEVFTIPPCPKGVGVCTSSATVSHSVSFGKADAVVAVASDAAWADAAATAIANEVRCESDVDKVLAKFGRRRYLNGLIVAIGERIGFWGDIALAGERRRQ